MILTISCCYQKTFQALNYPNQVIFFSDGYEAINYMRKNDVDPFLIMSDINMPAINGFELKQKIRANEALNEKDIPCLFLTTGAQITVVREAYSMSAQDFFIKPNTIGDPRNTILKIVEYWQECFSPNQSAHK